MTSERECETYPKTITGSWWLDNLVLFRKRIEAEDTSSQGALLATIRVASATGLLFQLARVVFVSSQSVWQIGAEVLFAG